LWNVAAADIVFDYRQKATRKFEYLQGDYYIAPAFLVSLFSSRAPILDLVYLTIFCTIVFFFQSD
jgi:hypothetical protein